MSEELVIGGIYKWNNTIIFVNHFGEVVPLANAFSVFPNGVPHPAAEMLYVHGVFLIEAKELLNV